MINLKHSHLTRQLDIIPIDKIDTEIHIIGAGAIGSLVSLNLAKMGFTKQTVYDYDTVSIENMSCQFYRHKDIDKPKVEALKDLIKDFTNEEIKIVNGKWQETTENKTMRGIVICAVDDMNARKEIFKAMSTRLNITHFIDTRMSMEDAAMYVMNPRNQKDVTSYTKTIYTNEEAVQERCTAKSTMYTATMLAGYACKAVKNIICEQTYPRVSQWSIANNQLVSFLDK